MAATLNDTDIERISNRVTEKLLEGLPALIKDVIKDDVKVAINECLPSVMENMDNERQATSRAKRDARDYMDDHRRSFSNKYKTRKEKYQQYSRCVHIIQLYDECLHETPPYIPKRFREDKYHARNERELEKIWNRSMSNMQCEYDILSIRKVDYRGEIDKFDASLREELQRKDL